MVMIFGLMAAPVAFALGFVLGRVWEIRREIRRSYFRRRYAASPWRQVDGGLGSEKSKNGRAVVTGAAS